MRNSALLAFVSIAIGLSTAAPAFDKAAEAAGLQYPFLLERLEFTLYSHGNSRYDASDFVAGGMNEAQAAATVENLVAIQRNEMSHRDYLAKAIKSLGGTPNLECQFNVEPLIGSAVAFARASRNVEAGGTGAYAGGIGTFKDPDTIAALATVLTIESRQQSSMNIVLGNDALPNRFDIALTPEEVLSIVGGLIVDCDVTKVLGIKPNPALTVTPANAAFFSPSSALKFSTPSTQTAKFCQFIVGGDVQATVKPIDNCVLPADAEGIFAVWLTSNDKPLPNDPFARKAFTNVVAGAQLVIVDTQSAFSQVFVPDQVLP